MFILYLHKVLIGIYSGRTPNFDHLFRKIDILCVKKCTQSLLLFLLEYYFRMEHTNNLCMPNTECWHVIWRWRCSFVQFRCPNKNDQMDGKDFTSMQIFPNDIHFYFEHFNWYFFFFCYDFFRMFFFSLSLSHLLRSCYFYALEIFRALCLWLILFSRINATNENRHKCTNLTNSTHSHNTQRCLSKALSLSFPLNANVGFYRSFLFVAGFHSLLVANVLCLWWHFNGAHAHEYATKKKYRKIKHRAEQTI